MSRPTKWTKAKDGRNETRKSSSNKTIHRQYLPNGRVVDHLHHGDGTTERLPNLTNDPAKPK